MSGRKKITIKDFSVPTAVIRLTNIREERGFKIGKYYAGLEHDTKALYEATRFAWSTKRNKKILDTRIALAVHDYMVLEVYEIDSWHKCEAKRVGKLNGYKDPKDRVEFSGKIAEESVRQKFKGASVEGLFKHGNACPVMCFG